jgi:hypothetical protein
MKNLLYLLAIAAAIAVAACAKDEPQEPPYRGHWIVGTWVLDSFSVEFRDTLLSDEQKKEYLALLDTSVYDTIYFFEDGRAVEPIIVGWSSAEGYIYRTDFIFALRDNRLSLYDDTGSSLEYMGYKITTYQNYTVLERSTIAFRLHSNFSSTTASMRTSYHKQP